MDTLRGILEYSPQKHSSVRIFTDSGEFNLWKKIEPTFWSLCGNTVIHKKDTLFFSLTFGATNWVFHYESKENMFLKKSGDKERFDVAAHLNSLFLLLDNQRVVVEADNEYFKIFAAGSSRK